MTIDQMIDGLLTREGGYVNHPADRGGPTNWGITQDVARKDGYTGDMRQLSRDRARTIYWNKFVRAPGIDKLAQRSARIAAEALDTGVNMGVGWGVVFLQVALNAFNSGGRDWPDLSRLDGDYGPTTDAALTAYIKRRAADDWEATMLAAMNAQQGARYLGIISGNPSQEAFAFGWFRHRVAAAA